MVRNTDSPAIDVEDVLSKLTLDEKISLLAGTIEILLDPELGTDGANSQVLTSGIPRRYTSTMSRQSELRMDQMACVERTSSMAFLRPAFHAVPG